MVKKTRGTKRRHKGTHKAAKKRTAKKRTAKKRTAKKHKLHIKRSIHSHRRKYRKLHVGGTGVISQASINQASADKKNEDNEVIRREVERRREEERRREMWSDADADADAAAQNAFHLLEIVPGRRSSSPFQPLD